MGLRGLFLDEPYIYLYPIIAASPNVLAARHQALSAPEFAYSNPYRDKINLLTPNVNYSGRNAPLTSKFAFYIFIQHIYILNILNMVYTLRFFLFKMQFVS